MKKIRQINMLKKNIWIFPLFRSGLGRLGPARIWPVGPKYQYRADWVHNWRQTSMQDWQEGWKVWPFVLVFLQFWFISDECTSQFKASYGCWGRPCDSATASNHHNFTCQLSKSLHSTRLLRRLWSPIFNPVSRGTSRQNWTRAFWVHRKDDE